MSWPIELANRSDTINDMDTPALELAAQRYRDAEAAFKAARDDLQIEAVNALRAGTKQADVARTTGWTREYIRRLKDDADKRDTEAATTD